MNYIEFAQLIKEKYPEYNDMSDLDLAKAMVAKYPQEYSDVTFEEVEQPTEQPQPKEPINEKGIDLTPSGLLNKGVAGALSPIGALVKGVSVPEAYNAIMEMNKQYEAEHPVSSAIHNLGMDILAYGKIPTVSVSNPLVNYGLNTLIQGGVIGGLEGLKNGNMLGGAGEGITIAGLLNTLPYLNKAGNFLANKGLKLAGRFAQLEPQTIEQAIKADSKALDLTKDQADRLALDTTERLRNDYNKLKELKAQEVAKEAKALEKLEGADGYKNLDDFINKKGISDEAIEAGLPENTYTVDTEKLYDLQKIADAAKKIKGGSQLNKNKEWYNLRDNLGDLENMGDLNSHLLENEIKNATHSEDIAEQAIRDLQNKKYRNYKYNEQEVAEQEFDLAYRKLLNKYEKDPSSVLEKDVQEVLNKTPFENDEQLFYETLVNDMSTIDKLKQYRTPKANLKQDIRDLLNTEQYGRINVADLTAPKFEKEANAVLDSIEGNNFTPYELLGAKRAIGKKINWNIPEEKEKNKLMKGLYDVYNKKLNTISPELEKANKSYEEVANYLGEKSRLRNVLNPDTNLESAVSALKNYKSTNDNIFDLEKQLLKEVNNAQPYINDINEANAALDLAKKEQTGLGGLSGLVKSVIVEPLLLRGARGVNRIKNNPIVEELKKLNKNVIKPTLIKGGSQPILYGGISNLTDDYTNYDTNTY